MRFAFRLAASLAFSLGCASVVGVDFDAYREGKDTATTGNAVRYCAPKETQVCACIADDGIQTCNEQHRFGPCVCSKPKVDGVVCGNGERDPGEACDDGNAVSNDGCSDRCIPDGRPNEVNACPGQALAIASGTTLRFDLVGITRTTLGSGTNCSSTTPDRVFSWTASASGTLVLTAATDAAVGISIRKDCAASQPPVACDHAVPGTDVTRKLPVTAGETYYLVIEATHAAPTAKISLAINAP